MFFSKNDLSYFWETMPLVFWHVRIILSWMMCRFTDRFWQGPSLFFKINKTLENAKIGMTLQLKRKMMCYFSESSNYTLFSWNTICFLKKCQLDTRTPKIRNQIINSNYGVKLRSQMMCQLRNKMMCKMRSQILWSQIKVFQKDHLFFKLKNISLTQKHQKWCVNLVKV